jgi:hypothetical protein
MQRSLDHSKPWRSIIIASVAWTLGAGYASAQDKPIAEVSSTTIYEFGDDQVLGDNVAPNGHVLTARARGARESLVQARLHFVRELCHSVEAL